MDYFKYSKCKTKIFHRMQITVDTGETSTQFILKATSRHATSITCHITMLFRCREEK